MSKEVKKKGHRGEKVSNETKAAFVMWLCNPDPKKTPSTQDDWATEHDLRPETVSRWKSEDAFVLGLMAEGEKLLAPFWTEAFANLVRIATQKADDYVAVSAIREMGKILGKYKPDKLEVSGRMGLLEFLGTAPSAQREARAN